MAVGLLLAAAGSGARGSAGKTPVDLTVRPGSVVRWGGDGIDSCGRERETWAPLADGCWFPIDLLEREGPIEVFRDRRGARERATIRVAGYPYPVQRIALEDSSRVELSPENLARVRRDQATVRPLWALRSPARFALPLAAPLDALGAAGSFGSRRFFNDQPRSPHSGADYPAAAGTAVYAVAPGRVVLAADLFFSGQSVFIDHGDGLISMYFHLRSILVEEGQRLDGRMPIGEVGQTGRTTGPHLHFGLRWKGARVDPSLLLDAGTLIPELAPAGG